jgi:integrase
VESTEGEMLILNVASLAFELGIRPSDLLSSSLSDFVLDMKIAELYKRKVENVMRERT